MVGIRNVVHSFIWVRGKENSDGRDECREGKVYLLHLFLQWFTSQRNHCYRVIISHLKHSLYIQPCMFTYKFNYLHNYGDSLCSFSIHEFSVFLFFFMNLLIFNRIYVVQKVWGHERWYMPQFSCQWYLFCSPVLIWQSFPWCFKICKLFKISCFKLQYNLLTQFFFVCVFYIHISLCTCYSQPMTY